MHYKINHLFRTFIGRINKLYLYYFQDADSNKENRSLWSCYIRKVWPNFYIAGVLKLFGDMIGVVPPLGLAIIIQYIEGPVQIYDHSTQVTVEEYLNNGYVMLLIVTLALISQAFLSQNSTHLVTVEGTRLKTALQVCSFTTYNFCFSYRCCFNRLNTSYLSYKSCILCSFLLTEHGIWQMYEASSLDPHRTDWRGWGNSAPAWPWREQHDKERTHHEPCVPGHV